jgi:uroporphyrinogen-III synthase
LNPSFVPTRFAAAEIAAGLGPVAGARVLLPQADIASPELAERLQAAGAHVNAVAAYRTVPIAPSEVDTSALADGADAIVLASGSAARSLASVGESSPTVRKAIERALLVCIGPKTAEVARDVGLPDGLVADEATADGIIHALTSHFGKNTPP